jgi:hypothetical protein
VFWAGNCSKGGPGGVEFYNMDFQGEWTSVLVSNVAVTKFVQCGFAAYSKDMADTDCAYLLCIMYMRYLYVEFVCI